MNPLKYIIFSFDGIGFPVAKKLIDEGAEVTVVQVENKKDLAMSGGEDPETKRRRMSLYDGVFPKMGLEEALNAMKSIQNKDDYFVWFDFNHLWKVSEQVEEMGYTKGLFIRKDDLTYEDDRNKAKDLVTKYYPDVNVAEVHEFTKSQDAIEFLNDTEDVWALKGNDEGAKTKVPSSDDPEKGKKVLIDLLTAHGSDYEKGGFILEKKIIDAYEITPQIVFWNGIPVYASADIENKPKGSGNEGIQLGCAQNLIVRLDLDDPIVGIAVPEYVHEMAKGRKGIFIWDCGLLYKDGEFFFTEFCAQRFGYDCLFTEIDMAGGARKYFESIASGVNPLIYHFGAAARGLNEHKDGKDRRVLEGIPMSFDNPDHTWVFEMKCEDEDYVTTGTDWDLVVFTGSGNTVNQAVDNAYAAREGFTFDDMAVRPKFDFMSTDYISSIPNRFNELNHDYFEAPDIYAGENERNASNLKIRLDAERKWHDDRIKGIQDGNHEEMKDLRNSHSEEVSGLKRDHAKAIDTINQEIDDILNKQDDGQ